jgi:CRP-like cAMP-binding protein
VNGTFLSRLTEPDRSALMQLARTRTIEPGRTVFREGDEATSFAVLLSGRVKLIGRASNGRQVLIGMRASGDIVGEMGAIDGMPRSVDVVAVDTVRMLIGTAGLLHDYLRTHPSGWTAICTGLSARLREADSDRIGASTLGGSARVAVRLAELGTRYGRRMAAASIELPISQDELADWTGLSRPTINRALGELRSAGLVETARRRIVITDADALAVHHLM